MAGAGGSLRPDVFATVAARRELGTDYEAALVESFAEKVDEAVAVRADAAVRAERRSSGWDSQGLVIALVSLGVSVPVTALAAITTGVEGVLVVWTGIVGVNLANAWGRRQARRH